jgi:hypothetical protein
MTWVPRLPEDRATAPDTHAWVPDAVLLAGLLVVGVGVPLAMAALAGAVGIPSNDDWVYMRSAEILFRTGRIAMAGHTAAALGQILLVQPLLWLSGGGRWAFTAFGLLMTAVALGATYVLARRYLTIPSAALVVLLLAAFPGFAREGATFMTDVPALALMLLSLVFGVVWLDRPDHQLAIVASMATGVAAVAIREYALAAPLAVLIAGWSRSQPERRVSLALVTAVSGVATLGALLAAVATPGNAVPLTVTLADLVLLGPAFATFGVALLPAIALAIPRRLTSVRRGQVIVGIALVSLLLLPSGSLVGDTWRANGLAGDSTLGGVRNAVLPYGAWLLSVQLGTFAATLLAVLAVGWVGATFGRAGSVQSVRERALAIARREDGSLVIFLVLYWAELVVACLLFYPLDRDLYPLLPVAGILLLRGAPRVARLGPRHALSHLAVGWLALNALAIAANSFAYDAARWRAGEAAVAIGYDARTVDAGYEWVGMHQDGAQKPPSAHPLLTGYDDSWVGFRVCAVVRNSPLSAAGYTLVSLNRNAYRNYLFFGPEEPLYLYGSTATGCPTPPRTIAARKPLARSAYTAAVSPGAGIGARGTGEANPS